MNRESLGLSPSLKVIPFNNPLESCGVFRSGSCTNCFGPWLVLYVSAFKLVLGQNFYVPKFCSCHRINTGFFSSCLR